MIDSWPVKANWRLLSSRFYSTIDIPVHLKAIRPAGNPITLNKSDFTTDVFSDFNINYYHSGTAALAAAITASINLKPGIAQPEVILPAYGCPDLISAIIYAGAKPILVDLCINTPFMSISTLKNAITLNTVALISVHFLGLQERSIILREICSTHQVMLIEDSAQGFPNSAYTDYWQGDFTILSFGRGKPINLLAGGAVLSQNTSLHRYLPDLKEHPNNYVKQLKYLIKAKFYNFSIAPIPYALISKLSWLRIGETIFKPLNKLEPIPAHILLYLQKNILAYQTNVNNALAIHNELSSLKENEIIDLPGAVKFNFSNHLLRYPLLTTTRSMRDRLYCKLSPYGASLMYKTSLDKINGVKSVLLNDAEFPIAQDFSNRLITLPTHSVVNNHFILKIINIIKNNT